MLKSISLQLFGLMMACRLLVYAGNVAVPAPLLYSDRLPPRIGVEVHAAVVDGVRQGGHTVVAGDEEVKSYLAELQGLTQDGKRSYLQSKGIDGLLRTELQRSLGGFVLRVEPVGCQPSLGFPDQPFTIQIGQYQNLPRCVAELAARLSTEARGAQALSAVLAPRILEPLAPLFLGNYLCARLESGLLARGYHLCTEENLGQALRANRLAGYFELTRDRREALANALQVQSFIQVTISEYQIQGQEDGLLQGTISGNLREISAFNGELLKSFPFQLSLNSRDGRLAAYPPRTLAEPNAFGQAALDLLVQEVLLPKWPPKTN